MRTSTQYLLAVVVIVLAVFICVVTLELVRPDGFNDRASYTILGIAGTVIPVLLSQMRTENQTQTVVKEAKSAAAQATEAAEAAKQIGS